MENLQINVEISFSKETIETLKQIATTAIMTTLSKSDIEQAKDIIAQAQYEEEKKETSAAEQETTDNPEADPAWYEVTDQELAQATKNAVQRVKAKHQSPAFIRTEIFKKYGISQSVDCPKERRAELLADLEAVENGEE